MEGVLLLTPASTGMMIGVDGWTGYAAAHGRRTTRVVGPPMLVELATGGLLVLRPPLAA